MRSALALSFIVVGIALEWVAIHGYNEPDPGFKGVLEAIYNGISKATAK